MRLYSSPKGRLAGSVRTGCRRFTKPQEERRACSPWRRAWHARVVADEVVSHAFSHGYHPDHTERLAAYWGEALGGPTTIRRLRRRDLRRADAQRQGPARGDGPSRDRLLRPGAAGRRLDATIGCARLLHDYFAWATADRWRATTARPTTCLTACGYLAGRGTVPSAQRHDGARRARARRAGGAARGGPERGWVRT